MKKVTLDVRYQLGHSYTFDFVETNLFCPNCGVKSVWMKDDGGDYYAGESYYCLNCKSEFNIKHLYDPPKDENEIGLESKQIFTGIKNYINTIK